MGEACNTKGENGNAYRLLVGKPEVEIPLKRSRRMWVTNIKINVPEIGWSRKLRLTAVGDPPS
jgi:hypothetical protein